jgi:hypothetical protein
MLFVIGGLLGVSLINPLEVSTGMRTPLTDFLLAYGTAAAFSGLFLLLLHRRWHDRIVWMAGAGGVATVVVLGLLMS